MKQFFLFLALIVSIACFSQRKDPKPVKSATTAKILAKQAPARDSMSSKKIDSLIARAAKETIGEAKRKGYFQ